MQLHRASEFSHIRQQIKDAAIENLWKGIEQGQSVDMLTEHLHKRQAEKEELETQLAIENNKKICLSEAQILAFLDYFNKHRANINIFVQSIYLYDDHFTLIINASKKPLSIDNIPLDDIEEAFEGENTETEGCSSLMTPAPPNKNRNFDTKRILIAVHFYLLKTACNQYLRHFCRLVKCQSE